MNSNTVKRLCVEHLLAFVRSITITISSAYRFKYLASDHLGARILARIARRSEYTIGPTCLGGELDCHLRIAVPDTELHIDFGQNRWQPLQVAVKVTKVVAWLVGCKSNLPSYYHGSKRPTAAAGSTS